MDNETGISERGHVEIPFMKQLKASGWTTIDLSDIDKHDPTKSNRDTLAQVIMPSELKAAFLRVNPWLSSAQADDLVIEMQSYSSRKLLDANIEVFDRLTGVALSRDDETTGETNKRVNVIDFSEVDTFNPTTLKNSFIAVSQFKVQISGMENYIIPDIVLFINGLPLVVIECKSPAIPDPIHQGIEQLLRYQDRRNAKTAEGVLELFYFNQFMVSTSFYEAKYSTITGSHSHFVEWKDPYPYKFNDIIANRAPSSQEILVKGMLSPGHLLDIIQNYDVYKDDDEGRTIKVVARYQQYRGARKIIERLRSNNSSTAKGGTVWHTQGSGKSLTMMFVIRKMYHSSDLNNFKIVLLLDRTDLQNQLKKTSSSVKYNCKVAKSIDGLKEQIKNTASDINIAMIHKFGERDERTVFPVLNTSDRILIMIDEAHRSQYKELAANMWQAMPNSVKVAFTGTPVDKTTNTFGGYIDTYTMRQAVEDDVVVPISYEGRATESSISNPEAMNNKFADIFGMEINEDTQKRVDHATLLGYLENATVIRNKANDMLDHYINSVFPNGFKAQVVASSREAAARYKKVFEELLPLKIAGLREHNPNNIDIELLVKLKVGCVISASNNDEPHLKELADESKNQKIIDGFKMSFKETDNKGHDSNYGIIVVKSMLLTGFDASIEQVMYLDQIIKNHNLLQTIARVNRKCGADKKFGYLVDYIGLVKHLKEALAEYADADVRETLDVLQDQQESLDKLHSIYLNFLQFIKDKVKVKSLSEANSIIEALVAEQKLREEFNAHFRMLTKMFDRVLPNPAALRYKEAYRTLAFIRQSVANLCRDTRFSIKDVSKKVRAIIEEYLVVHGVDPKIPPIEILSDEFGVQTKEKSIRTKCDELTYAIKEYINVNHCKDPELFDRMSEKLERLLKQFKDNWGDLYIALDQMRQNDIRNGRKRENTFGFEPQHEMPFFALFKREVFGNKEYNEFTEEEFKALKDLTSDVLKTVKLNTAMVNFWSNISQQNNLRQHIIEQLLKSFRKEFNQRKAIAQKIMELAYCHYGRNQ